MDRRIVRPLYVLHLSKPKSFLSAKRCYVSRYTTVASCYFLVHSAEADLNVSINFSDLKPYFPSLPWSRKFRLEEVFEDEFLGTFSFHDTFGLERGNIDAATVMLVTLSLLDSNPGKGPTEEEEEEGDYRWRGEEIIADMKRRKESRKNDAKFYKKLTLCSLAVAFLVMLGLRFRFSICRRLSSFRPFER